MRPYRYALAITSQFYFCGIPFRLDTVPKCPLNCSYCFAMSKGGRPTPANLVANPSQIARKFETVNRHGSEASDITGELLERRLPIHFGGLSDPFANRLVAERSKELLAILAEFDYPTVISTKNTDQMEREEVLAVFKRFRNLVIQVSIPSYNADFAKAIEPNVPPPAERLRVLALLAQEGYHTIVRLQPLFPEQVNSAAEDLIPRLAEAQVKHVVVEFLKLPLESSSCDTSYLFTTLNWSRSNVYRSRHAMRTAREWILQPRYKWELLQPVIQSIHDNRMTFGAGDYGLNHLGDTDCCCGIDVVDGFSEWFHPNMAYVIRSSKSPVLDIGILDEASFPQKSIRMYLNSHCRGRGETTIYDFMRLKWNRPGTENAPDSFLGVSFRGDYDNSANCIYVKEPV